MVGPIVGGIKLLDEKRSFYIQTCFKKRLKQILMGFGIPSNFGNEIIYFLDKI
jgi:hypothetical protein